MYRAIQVQTAR